MNNTQVAAWLEEAADDIEYWGAYATTYFQMKHDLEGDLQKFKDRAEMVRTASDRPSKGNDD